MDIFSHLFDVKPKLYFFKFEQRQCQFQTISDKQNDGKRRNLIHELRAAFMTNTLPRVRPRNFQPRRSISFHPAQGKFLPSKAASEPWRGHGANAK